MYIDGDFLKIECNLHADQQPHALNSISLSLTKEFV